MAYIPLKTVSTRGNKLTESSDLTRTLSSVLMTQTYLVLEKDSRWTVIDLDKLVLFEQNINTALPLATALSAVLSDIVVMRYTVTHVPTKNRLGLYENRLRVFSPISYKDYKVQFTSVDTPAVVDDVTRKGYLDDLVVTSAEDLSHCLAAVNGVFHKTVMFEKKLYILDGFRTCRISGRKDVTLVDTRLLGGHSVIPLTTNNVRLTSYNALATVTLPASAKGKSVFLVVDGYFYHLEQDVFYFADDTHIKIKTHKLPLITQFRHNPRTMRTKDRFGIDAPQGSRKYTDAYSAKLLDSRFVPQTELTTLAFQQSRLTHYHSFLVVMDAPAVYPVSLDVTPTGTPQFYIDHSDRFLSGMMRYSAGLCPSYLIFRDPFKRKLIWIQEQDNSLDYQAESISPAFLPAPSPDPIESAGLPARFIDYVSA